MRSVEDCTSALQDHERMGQAAHNRPARAAARAASRPVGDGGLRDGDGPVARLFARPHFQQHP